MRERDRQTDREREREKQRDGQTDRQTDRQIEIDRVNERLYYSFQFKNKEFCFQLYSCIIQL